MYKFKTYFLMLYVTFFLHTLMILLKILGDIDIIM